MDWPDLEHRALGHWSNLGEAAHAKAEIRRREAEQRAMERQLDIETAERIARMQIEAAEKAARQQLPIARASAWAAGFSAVATAILALIALLTFSE